MKSLGISSPSHLLAYALGEVLTVILPWFYQQHLNCPQTPCFPLHSPHCLGVILLECESDILSYFSVWNFQQLPTALGIKLISWPRIQSPLPDANPSRIPALPLVRPQPSAPLFWSSQPMGVSESNKQSPGCCASARAASSPRDACSYPQNSCVSSQLQHFLLWMAPLPSAEFHESICYLCHAYFFMGASLCLDSAPQGHSLLCSFIFLPNTQHLAGVQ